MSHPAPLLAAPTLTTDTPRARRGAAAVFAQYIQDLSHPSTPSAAAA